MVTSGAPLPAEAPTRATRRLLLAALLVAPAALGGCEAVAGLHDLVYEADGATDASGDTSTADAVDAPTDDADGSTDGPVDDAARDADAASSDASSDASPDASPDASDASPGVAPTLGGCSMFPASDEWNRDVSADATDPDSATYLASMGLTTILHANWGPTDDRYGLPYVVVPASQALVPVVFADPAQSDPGPYPIPSAVRLSDLTHRALVLQQGTCLLFETAGSTQDATGAGWHATLGAKFDLGTGALRADGLGAPSASGMPLLPGLVRADELLDRREIRHALSFVMSATRAAYVHPATSAVGAATSVTLPPMGLRVRLKASFDVSSFGPETQILLGALKRYGMFLTDVGSDWYVTGTNDDRWTTTLVGEFNADLFRVHGSDFEVVKLGAVHPK
jgi:hypothetical protein